MSKVYARPKGKGVHRHGTAADLADQGQGYASSGESQFTRIAASGEGGAMMVHQEPRGPRGHGLPMLDLIRRTSGELRHINVILAWRMIRSAARSSSRISKSKPASWQSSMRRRRHD